MRRCCGRRGKPGARPMLAVVPPMVRTATHERLASYDPGARAGPGSRYVPTPRADPRTCHSPPPILFPRRPAETSTRACQPRHRPHTTARARATAASCGTTTRRTIAWTGSTMVRTMGRAGTSAVLNRRPHWTVRIHMCTTYIALYLFLAGLLYFSRICTRLRSARALLYIFVGSPAALLDPGSRTRGMIT